MRNEIIKVVEDVLREYGYKDIKILEEYHRNVQKMIYKVSVDNKLIVIRGIANTVSEAVIEGNTLAHIFLGNDKGLAPGIIENQDGKRYVQKAGYWFYVLEYIEGENLKENVNDDSGLGSRYLDLGWSFIMQFVEYEKKTGSMKYRFDLAEAFLKGYYGEDKISEEEKEDVASDRRRR